MSNANMITDKECFAAAVCKLAAHDRIRPDNATDDDMDQAWHDTREVLLGRVAYYEALVHGDSHEDALCMADSAIAVATWAGMRGKRNTVIIDTLGAP